MKVKFINSAILMIAVLILSTSSAFAQESEAVVIDEVVAQINDGVITLSRIKREMKNSIDSLVAQGKTPEAAKAEIESKKGEIIASLINEELVIQKGKEIGVDSAVEAQINQRITQIMKEGNIKTLDALYKEMEKANVKPDDFRDNLRKQYTKEMVYQRDVDQKVYLGWSSKEIKDYYEKNKDKFTKPETVTLSEIFLGFAGRDMDAIRKKADQLIASLRGGADFAKVALENSDTPNVAQSKGLVGTFTAKELNENIANVVKNIKTGDVGKLENEEGIEIIRVDARDNASSESVFNENAVRTAMTYEKLPDERKKYLKDLRKDAYVKISESYRPLVMPFLPMEENKTEAKKTSK
jgi:predicted RNase H-like HicB family nuclease